MNTSLHDRMISAARERAAATGTSFPKAQDDIAIRHGFDDWSHFEHMYRRPGVLHRMDFGFLLTESDLLYARIGNRSENPDVFDRVVCFSIDLFRRILRSVQDRIAASRRAQAWATATALVSLLLTLWMIVLNTGTHLVVIPSMFATSTVLSIAYVTPRVMAARSDPSHAGAVMLLQFPINGMLVQILWCAMMGVMTLMTVLSETGAQHKGLALWIIGTSMASSWLWLVSMGLVLMEGKDRGHG